MPDVSFNILPKIAFLPKNEVFYKENDDLELFLMLFFQCYILIGKK